MAWLVLLAGIVASLALQMFVPPVEVFWSGDGGLKNLMAKQFAHGIMHVDLRLTNKEWVSKLWDDGLHPAAYGDYVYKIDGKYFSVFPYPFPAVSAPFYALWGVRGYYVIPIVSLWVVWIVLYLAMHRAAVDPCMEAALLFAFVFATPVMLYAATFWEHTLGLALALGAIVYTLRYGDEVPGATGPKLAGTALGLAVWFRPETLALIAALVPAAFIWRRDALGVRGWFRFSAAAVLTVMLFFAINFFIYRHPLGTHAIQMMAEQAKTNGAHEILPRFVSLATLCVRFAPVAGFVVFLFTVLAWKRRINWKSEYVYLSVVAVVFFPLMVVMVPTDGGFQLGPRFALLLFPLLILICAYAWRSVPRATALHCVAIAVLIYTIVIGVKRSAIGETRWLAREYRERVQPAYAFVAAREETVVAVSRVETTLELGGLMEKKDFFAAFDDAQFAKLLAALRTERIDKFLFIAFGDETGEQDSVLRHAAGQRLIIDPLGRHGTHFYCYAVTIPPGV